MSSDIVVLKIGTCLVGFSQEPLLCPCDYLDSWLAGGLRSIRVACMSLKVKLGEVVCVGLGCCMIICPTENFEVYRSPGTGAHL